RGHPARHARRLRQDRRSEVADVAGPRRRVARGGVPQDHERSVMTGAFWFITFRSFKNRLMLRLRRLREPRYLIGFIAGLSSLWFMFLRRLFFSPHGSRIGVVVAGPVPSAAIDGVSIVALFGLLLPWAFPEQSGGMTFSPAEIQFLFPAPISRRQLLYYKVFR